MSFRRDLPAGFSWEKKLAADEAERKRRRAAGEPAPAPATEEEKRCAAADSKRRDERAGGELAAQDDEDRDAYLQMRERAREELALWEQGSVGGSEAYASRTKPEDK